MKISLTKEISLKRNKLSEFVTSFAQFKNINSADLGIFFFRTLEQIHETKPAISFWINRDFLWNNMSHIQLLVVDLADLNILTEKGVQYLNTLINPWDYARFLFNNRLLIFGWVLVTSKDQSLPDPVGYILQFFDIFVRGYNLGDTMWNMCKEYYRCEALNAGSSNSVTVPYNIVDTAYEYWAKRSFREFQNMKKADFEQMLLNLRIDPKVFIPILRKEGFKFKRKVVTKNF